MQLRRAMVVLESERSGRAAQCSSRKAGGHHPGEMLESLAADTQCNRKREDGNCGDEDSGAGGLEDASKGRAKMANKKILIVEDDPDVLKAMHVRLQANHYDTFMAADVISSVVEARKYHPDLVLLDLGLPGESGFVAMERFQANPYLASIPIIVVSGRTGPDSQVRAMKAGARAFLEKPVDSDKLIAVIRQALGESSESEKPVVTVRV
jgi:CheY-like chemotaxis protein